MRRELLELKAVFKGRVQGVGFRAKTKDYADRLKLTGYVRNLSDGSVKICAQGEKPALEQLLSQLRKEFGPSIHQVDYDFFKVLGSYSSFSINR